MSRLSAISSRLIPRGRPAATDGRAAALTLRDARNDREGAAALDELGTTYAISEVAGGLLLIQRDADLRLFLYDLEAVVGAARRNAERREQEARRARQSSKRYGPEDIVSGSNDLASALQMIAQLEARILALQSTRKDAIEQREHWRQRAIRAEARLSGPEAPVSGGAADGRYPALRRFLAKQFHPDHAPGSGIEKIIRNEMFKEIWAEIGRIDAAGH